MSLELLTLQDSLEYGIKHRYLDAQDIQAMHRAMDVLRKIERLDAPRLKEVAAKHMAEAYPELAGSFTGLMGLTIRK